MRVERGDVFQETKSSLITESPKLPDSDFVTIGTDRVFHARRFFDLSQKVKKMAPYILRIGRVFPDVPGHFLGRRGLARWERDRVAETVSCDWHSASGMLHCLMLD
jgi:hypothetical protein